jgi:hypothetical protein
LSLNRGLVLAGLLVLPVLAQAPLQRDIKIVKDAKPLPPKPVPTVSENEITAWPPSTKRWALIIGVDQYDDRQITPLLAASNDAVALSEAFIRYAGFPREQVILLASNQPEERRPTRGNILVRLSNLSRLVPKDGLLLVAFAGHGIERNGQAFLLPADAKVNDNIRVLQETSLNVTQVKDWIQDMGVKQALILLDACRNDPTAGRGDTPNRMTEAYRRGFTFDTRNREVEAFATLYATRIGERAYEYSEKRHGYFTWAIIEGLKGKAANERGEVTLGGLEQYIQDAVPRQISIDLGAGKDQRPFADVRGYKASELVIAKVSPGDAQAMQASVDPPAPDLRVVQLEEWQRISSSRDISVFAEFRKRYPDGLLADQARQRMEVLAWEAAKASKNPEILREFLAQYPSAIFADTARQEIQAFEQRASISQQIQAALDGFRQAYESRDVHRLKLVWPSLDNSRLRSFEEFFKIAKSVTIQLQPTGEPTLEGDRASVVCRRLIEFADSRNNTKRTDDVVTIRLRAAGNSWVFESW